MSSLVVVGDALLDRDVSGTVERLCPDAPVPVVDQRGAVVRPGGAGLAAALAAADGHEVTLVTALARDGAGEELRATLSACGVDVVDLGCDGATMEKVRVLCEGRSLLRVDRGGGGAVGALSAEGRAAIGWADGVLVADYGRGMTACDDVRSALGDRVAAGGGVVWDPHPRGAVPVRGVSLVTPNAVEASAFAATALAHGIEGSERSVGAHDGGFLDAAGCATRLAAVWGCAWVCATRDASGAVLCGEDGGTPLAFAARTVHGGDPCGAGDRFAASAAAALAGGADVPTAVGAAVEAATAFVAAGGATRARLSGAGVPSRCRSTTADQDGSSYDGALTLIDRVRATGGTVVATGGCFDLLHAGHVQTLQAARTLGDALIVCLNGDASVRRLKGAGRPLVGEDDRAAVLRALGCVDAVAVFDEDTPVELLRRLRPHVWAKGGDYAHERLPETDALRAWGGRTVILPFVEGRSTTRLIEEVALRA